MDIFVFLVFAAFGGLFAILGIRGRRHHRIGRDSPSDREREEREIRAILDGTDEPRTEHAPPPTFVADTTVRFACADCGELTASTELETRNGKRFCPACRAKQDENEVTTYRDA